MSTTTEEEIASAGNFVRWYSNTRGRELITLEKQEAPDFLCKFRDGDIGLEITTAYYDNQHARAVWDIAREKVMPRKIHEMSSNGDECEFHEVWEP